MLKNFKAVFQTKNKLWSYNCIVKETLRNQSKKVDYLANKYLNVLQGFGITDMITNQAQY